MSAAPRIAAIVPQFFTTDLDRTLRWYDRHLGFETQFRYGEPAAFAGAIRDGLSIFFRHVDRAMPQPDDKEEEELLDAYLRVEGIAGIFDDLAARGAPFARGLTPMPWGLTEFVVRDCDGRLLCFGEETAP